MSADPLSCIAAETRAAIETLDLNRVTRPESDSTVAAAAGNLPAVTTSPEAVVTNNATAESKKIWYDELVARYGDPIAYGPKGALLWSEIFFAAKFQVDNDVLFSPEENRFYLYDETTGLWKHETEAAMKVKLYRSVLEYAHTLGLHRKIPYDLDDRHQRSLVSHLKGLAEERNAFRSRHGIIHAKNCVLDLTGEVIKLEKFSPKFRSRNQVPFDFDERARCDRFLNELLRPALSEEDIDLFQRWCGSLLIGKNRAQRIMLVIGLPGGGKSTMLSVVEAIIGECNIAELRIDQLASRFEKSRLVGKLLLVGKDVGSDYLSDKSVGNLKSLTGGDRMTAELKGSNEVILFRGEFGVVVVLNAMPRLRTDDDVDAWRRRLLAILFAGKKPAKPIPGFAEHLVETEGAGILRWMVEGAVKHMNELETHGGYVLTPAQEERINGILAESNSIQEFIATRVVKDVCSEVTTEEIQQAYEKFCGEKGWTPAPVRTICEQTKQLMMERHRVTQSHDINRFGRTCRGYRKVKIVTTEELAKPSTSEEEREEEPVGKHPRRETDDVDF